MSLLWKAPEYMHTEKNSDWYWIVGIVSATCIIIAILLDNVMLALLILVSAFILTLYASRPPREHEIEITNKGIRLDKFFYPFSSIESFWVEEEQLHPRILIKTTRRWAPYVTALLTTVSGDQVREFLVNYIPEEYHSEPFIEKLFIYLGF